MADGLAFGPFLLDPVRGRWLRDGAPVALGQRAVALLEALAEARGGVVSKDALMDRAWPGTYVEEGNLSVQIAALRKALGEAPDGQSWIVTVPRVGYRLLPEHAAPERSEPVRGRAPGVAVLPFQIFGDAGGGVEALAEGVASEIATALTRFRSLALASRGSASVYRGRAIDARDVARELGVGYLLEGGLRRSGERLRVSVELVDGASGAQLWAERYDGDAADIFALQDRIAGSVASMVEPQILRAELERSLRDRPGSADPHDVMLQAFPAVLVESEAANAAAFARVTAALTLRPDDPMLLAHATWALEHRLTMGWPALGPDDVAQCLELARRGLEHAAGDPTVMAPCGMALLQVGKDYDVGLAVLQSAADANPNHQLAVTAAGIGHLHCGGLDVALDLMHRAYRLNPRHPFARMALCGIAHAELVRGNYVAALDWAERSRAVSPSFDCAHWMLTAASALLGHQAEARRFRDALLRLTPGITIARIRNGQPAKNPSRIAAMLEGLRLAGLPEG